jgi:hypothetical protein
MATYDEDLIESDEDFETEYAAEEVDDMLDSLMESDEDIEWAERRGRRRGRRGKPPAQPPVRTATGQTAYKPPAGTQGFVTQAQLKDALARVGNDVRRNAMGIKTVNVQVGRLTSQVRDVVAVNTVQSTRLGRLDKQIQLDGALDFATSFQVVTDAAGTSLVPNLPALLRGALKVGAFGNLKGGFANPLVIGGVGLLLNNPQILGGLFSPRTP